MHFSTILALSSLAGTIQAAAIQATRGHAAQFRIFGKPGCFAENEGFFLVQQGQIRPEQCYGYENNTVESLWVEQIRHGCRCKWQYICKHYNFERT